MAVADPQQTQYLKTGEEYVKSLQDDREVYYKGERVEDVTTHVATGGGIREIAAVYDDQFDAQAQNVLTYVRDDGARVTSSYLIPRTRDDLRFRREGIKHVARATWGTHGRGIDMIATLPLGMLGELPSFKRECPEFAENIHWYLKHAEENNIHLGETIVDPQGFRSRAAGTAPETPAPERATARIVKEDSTGIWISGVKGVGTCVPQANELVLGSLPPAARRGELLGLRARRLPGPADVLPRAGAPAGRQRLRPPADLARRGDRVDRRLRQPLRARASGSWPRARARCTA